MDQLTNQQIEKAVNWWAEVVCHPKYDNGDPSSESVFACRMAALNVEPVSQKQKAIFMKALSDILQHHKNDICLRGLRCDYEPDQVLMIAFNESQIPSTNAPFKTNMRFRDGEVKVRYGYSAEWVTL